MKELVFFIQGDAVPKQSFRMGANGPYQSSRVIKWENRVRQESAKAMLNRRPARGAVKVGLDFVMRTISKADLDNLVKGVLDGIKGIVFQDDVQVVELAAGKHSHIPERNEPGVLVQIYAVPGVRVGLPRKKSAEELQKDRAQKAVKEQKKRIKEMDE